MDMPKNWPHLLSDELDGRIKHIVEFVDFKDKVVVDFNCGRASTLGYIDNYKEYIGNDISQEWLGLAPKKDRTSFFCEPDTEFSKRDLVGTDILLALGLVIGYGDESKTQDKSLIRIINKNNPNMIVFEAVIEYWDRFDLYGRLIVPISGKYKIDKVKEFGDKADASHKQRRIYFLSKC